MSGVGKITAERNQKTLLELVAKPGNDVCADCKARNPRWASHNLGIFLCVNCAAIHRKIGTHITKVKRLTMDAWTKEQVEVMKSIGNVKSNSMYNPNELRHPPPANLINGERDGEVEQYIRSKYEFKRFLDKSLVSSRLGPSKSTSLVASTSGNLRSVSTPLTSNQASQVSAPASKAPAEAVPGPSSSYRSSAATTGVPRSVSQPVVTSQYPSQQPTQQSNPASSTPARKEGVWADLISLQTSSNSSLPLQYQPSQHSFSEGFGSYQNSPQPGQLASNPYSQQMFATPPAQFSSFPTTTPVSAVPMLNPQQPYFSQMQPPMSAPGTQLQSNFFQPQPLQSSLQNQAPMGTMGQALYGNAQGGLLSAPATQGHFMSPSAGQPFQSHSPQPMLSTTPQPQSQGLPMSQPVMGQPVQYLPAGSNMNGQLPMQMMQQQGLYNAQPQGQFGGFQAQPYQSGGFSGTQQWGAM